MPTSYRSIPCPPVLQSRIIRVQARGCHTNRAVKVHKLLRMQNPPTPALSPLVKGGEGRGEGGFEADGFINFGSAIGITTYNYPPVDYTVTYGLNEILLGRQSWMQNDATYAGPVPMRLAALERPAEMGLIGDSGRYAPWGSFICWEDLDRDNRTEGYWCSSDITQQVCPGGNWIYGIPRHFEGIKVVYADAHAAFSGKRTRSSTRNTQWGCYFYARVKVWLLL